MDIRERAAQILQHAETSLRTLVAEAAANGDYETVVRLASWARSVGDLVKTAVGGSEQHANRGQSRQVGINERRQSLAGQSARKAVPPGDSRKAYPRFFRQGEQLVKVAWSKREKKEYQHKAPFAVLMALSSAVAKVGADGRVFSTERILPLEHSVDGTDIPTYQVYVCLALLRRVGLVDQHGRQGYSIREVKEFAQAVESAWRQLPEH